MPNYDPSTPATAALLRFGARADKAAATLPQSTIGTIFTVTGGRVIINLLIGEVTTIIQAQSTTLKVTSTPTAGTAVDVSATVDINALEVGGKVSVIGTFATALGKANAGAVQGLNVAPFVVAVGTIGITTGASSTGAMKWSCWWMPFDDGASLA